MAWMNKKKEEGKGNIHLKEALMDRGFEMTRAEV